MTAEVVSLGERKAEATGDCREMTVLDALRAAIRDIEAGKMMPQQVYIAFREVQPGGKAVYQHYAAGIGTCEALGILTRHIHKVCDRA